MISKLLSLIVFLMVVMAACVSPPESAPQDELLIVVEASNIGFDQEAWEDAGWTVSDGSPR